ncbi:MAG: ATP-binding protein [Pseudomonadota bacterium]
MEDTVLPVPAFPPAAIRGDMADRVRQLDWSRTPLGAPATWPDSLRTMVQVILCAREPRFIVWGPERTLLYNQAYAALCGARHPAALGQPFGQVWSDAMALLGPLLDSAYAGETVHRDDLRFTLRERLGYPEEARFSFSYIPVYGRGGAVAGVVCTGLETTETESALRRTRARLAATLEAADIATWDYDVERDLLLPDDNLSSLFGTLAGEAALGAPLEAFILGCHPDDRDRVRQSLQEALATDDGWQSEHRIVQQDGAQRWIIARGRIERNAAGRPQRMPGVLVDITDRKRAEEALQDADRRKDEFLATLAHELRNPLAPIRSAARISSDPSATLQQLRWSHEVIERQVRTMALLLDDLLDVSRITRGILEVRKEPIQAAAIVEAALETARPVIDARRHRLDVQVEPLPVYIVADPLRVAQALSNLLTNAAKYTDPGGRITLSALLEDGTLVLRVRDTGIGVAPTSLQRIFAMFSQVESALDRSEGGLGIGLALVKGIVELHGGSVQAHSAGLGLGSEFVLRIPGASQAGPAAAPPAPAPQQAAPAATALRVALADDNVDGAETLAALLELDGYEVRIAHDGLAALDLVHDFAPHAVFLDIGMPGLNGYEVARQLRQDSGGAAPVLVALTGWGGAEDKKRALAAGFDHHLTKPVDPDAISAILAAIVSTAG